MLVQSRRDEEGFTHGGGPSDWPYLSGPSCINLQGNKKLWRLVFFPNHFPRRRRRRASTHRGVLASSAAVCLFVRVRCCDDAGRRDSATFGDGGSFLLWRMSPPQKPSLSFRRRSYAADPSLCAHTCVSPSPPQPSLNSLAGTAETESELFKLLPFDRKSFNIKRKNKQRTSKQAQKQQLASCFFFFDVAILECACAKFGVGSIFFFMWRGAPWLHFSLDVFRVCFLRILHRLLA